ncbi:MAG: Fur family transcriptional regulator [Planctomycetota bacterium]
MTRKKKGLEEFERALRRRGLKLTAPRRRVTKKLLSLRGHFNAEELQDMLKKDGTPVSKATVYRTLSLLEECGIFDSHDFGGGPKVYEKAVDRAHHDHLCCIACGALIEFHEPAIEHLQKKVVRRYGFAPVYHSHKIFGYCTRCAKKGRRP